MKQDWKEGLSMGLCIWFLSLVLGIPLAFLQMGYLPRYLLQLILAIVLLVRGCRNPVREYWISLFTMECLVIVASVVQIARGNTTMETCVVSGFEGLALLLSGCFGLVIFAVLLLVSVCLFVRHKDEATTVK